MANDWNPLFDLMESSLLTLGPDAVSVFMVLLSRKDQRGETRHISPVALADRLRISVERVEQALKDLQEPDPHSRTSADAGAHIVWVADDECWFIPSHAKWRTLMSAERRRARDADRQRRKRARDVGRCEEDGCERPSEGERPGDGWHVCSAHAFEEVPF